ncbi:hypothetical protein [Salinibacterium sp.]|uniref:hypothetical protein n=1 Tax=Salinibacterium sp. TaxID=1915057 RepID=UPI00286AC81A|nr:hypothetical protein [Salinibacterium sp.]
MTDPDYQSQLMVPRAPRPPLGSRERSGARTAGIVGFLLLNLGFSLLWIPLALLALVGVVAVILTALDRAVYRPGSAYEGMIGFLESLDPSAAVVPLLLVALLGAAVIAAALFASARILRSHGVAKPWPVTWAAAGVAVVSHWLVSSLLIIPFQVITSGVDNDGMRNDGLQGLPIVIALGVISFLVSIALAAVVGWLSWWWMAHVMRPGPSMAAAVA